jgi:hypothetical protein
MEARNGTLLTFDWLLSTATARVVRCSEQPITIKNEKSAVPVLTNESNRLVIVGGQQRQNADDQ